MENEENRQRKSNELFVGSPARVAKRSDGPPKRSNSMCLLCKLIRELHCELDRLWPYAGKSMGTSFSSSHPSRYPKVTCL
jgi:hypothetical protein